MCLCLKHTVSALADGIQLSYPDLMSLVGHLSEQIAMCGTLISLYTNRGCTKL